MKKLFSFLLSSLLLASCVSVQRFDAKQAELDAKQTELNACQAQAKQDAQAWDVKRSALESKLKQVSQDRDSCQQKYQQTLTTAQDLEKHADALRLSLQDEIRTRDVEIETLKDKLTVRVLNRILFKSGSAQILPAGIAVLNKLGKDLEMTQDYIRVEGHTDRVPIGPQLKTKYYSNWELSAARAASVVRYFEFAQKIDPLRLEAVGFSKYRPVAMGNTPEDLQRNRRVEIVITAPPARVPTPKP